jgi:hypothetical protein
LRKVEETFFSVYSHPQSEIFTVGNGAAHTYYSYLTLVLALSLHGAGALDYNFISR